MKKFIDKTNHEIAGTSYSQDRDMLQKEQHMRIESHTNLKLQLIEFRTQLHNHVYGFKPTETEKIIYHTAALKQRRSINFHADIPETETETETFDAPPEPACELALHSRLLLKRILLCINCVILPLKKLNGPEQDSKKNITFGTLPHPSIRLPGPRLLTRKKKRQLILSS